MNRHLMRTATASELHAAALVGGKDDDAEFLLRLAAPRAREVEVARRGHVDIRLESTSAPEPCTLCGLTVAAGEHIERVKGQRGGRHPDCGLRARRSA